MNRKEFKKIKHLDLNTKIAKTKVRLREWIKHWGRDGVYLSFSGGKDSTVLKHIMDSMPLCDTIPLVFCDTGLQYPEVKEFAKSFIEDPENFREVKKYGYVQRYYDEDSFVIIKPKMPFREVIERYGYPVVSKEQSKYIYDYRNTGSDYIKKIRLDGNKNGNFKISKKWRFLIDAPFEVSDKCCYVMKKRPFKRYEKESGRKPILATMATDSNLRMQRYMQQGSCNAFDLKRPRSAPMSFWTEQDVLKYINKFNIEISSIYGEVIKENGRYKTTDRKRTGCIWCLFGIDRDEEPNRIQKLKRSHPKLYKYCINNLGLGEVLDYLDIPY